MNNNVSGDTGTRLKFWGVRGSIPTPGTETVGYGGNTSCVELRVNGEIIILDAGSGMRRLGQSLAREFKGQPIALNLLVTHTHWDHIQGFPFFIPAYNPKNKVHIYGYEGARQGLQSTLSAQMESPYFPISMRQMPGHISINEVKEMAFQVNGVKVRAQFVNHPGLCVGYRISTPGGDISYVPDVELFQRLRCELAPDGKQLSAEENEFAHEQDRELLNFVQGSEVLILDSQYDAAEYANFVGWGHSCVEDSVAFGVKAGVKKLFLFHHDPDHHDEKVLQMLTHGKKLASERGSKVEIEAAREGLEVILPNKAT